MKFIHSYVPPKNGTTVYDKNQFINMLLSALLVKKHYGNIVLYTTEEYGEIIKKIGIPYDEINTTLLNDFNEKTFSISKMLVYLDQNEPFIHIDNDTFIFDKINFKENNDFFFAHIDQIGYDLSEYKSFIRVYDLYYKPLSKLKSQPKEFIENIYLNQIPNMSIFGGYNYKAIKSATKKALEVYYENKDIFDENYYHACVAEQLLIYSFIRYYSPDLKKNTFDPNNWVSNKRPFMCEHEDILEVTLPFTFYAFGEKISINSESNLLDLIDFNFGGWTHLGGYKFLDIFQFTFLNKIIKNFNGQKYIDSLNEIYPNRAKYEYIGSNENISTNKKIFFNIAKETFDIFKKDPLSIDFGNPIWADNISVEPINVLLSNNKKGIIYIDVRTNASENFEWFIENKIKNKLTDDIVKFIKSKNGLLIIDYRTEGSVYSKESLTCVSELSDMYDFNKENVLFVTSNKLLDEEYKQGDQNFTLFTYDYFEESLWFIPRSKKIPETFIKHFTNLKNRSTTSFEKHFLCLNRQPRDHRVVLYCVIKNNEELYNKCYITLGLGNLSEDAGFEEPIFFIKEIDKLTGGESYYETFKNLTIGKSIELDHDLKINASASINEDFHNTTFCNIVTETLYHSREMFFSEKIYKPIYMMQPFILLGNPNSLKELKKMGYKTFSKWWDESYDEELDLPKRILMIEKILLEISEYSNEDLIRIKEEMREILEHNFFNLFNRTNKNILASKLYEMGFASI